MRKQIKIFLFVLIAVTNTFAQKISEVKKVEASIEKLRTAMIDGNKDNLEIIAVDDLSYGHSSGAVENKTEFIEKIVSGKSDFVTIELTQQLIKVTGDVATVRHNFKAITNNNGVSGDVNLHILTVWVKQKGDWKLLARQAVKLVQ